MNGEIRKKAYKVQRNEMTMEQEMRRKDEGNEALTDTGTQERREGRSEGTKGHRNAGTKGRKGQRNEGTKARRHEGTKGHRNARTRGRRHE